MLAGVAVLSPISVPAASAQPAPTLALHVTLEPNRPGARTTIVLSMRVGGSASSPGAGDSPSPSAEGGAPSPMTSLQLRLPENIGIATSTLGEEQCEAQRLLEDGLGGCSRDARVGYGTATALVPLGAREVTEPASVQALMGPSHEDRVEILFYVRALEPVFAQLVLGSVVEEASAPYGEALDTTLPLVQSWPEGPDMALTAFTSTLGPLGLTYERRVNGQFVAYHPRGIRLPKRCPAGGFPFQAVAGFLDGAHAAASYRVRCVRA